jgi:hypothetical protein
MRKFLMAAPLMALAGCSIGADLPVAERGVVALHAQLNGGKCAAIRETSAAEFREMATAETWLSMCGQLARGLGNFKSGQQIGWQDQNVNGDHRISLVYQSAFDKGAGREEFLFRIQGGKALLLGYHVNSPVFDEPGNSTGPANTTEPVNSAAPA